MSTTPSSPAAPVKRSPATHLFVVPPPPLNPPNPLYNPKLPSPQTVDSQDFDDLIFALKTGGGNGGGGGYTSDSTQPVEKPPASPGALSQYERRRINIPDTHL